LLHGYRRFC
jgi:hypothetical protein